MWCTNTLPLLLCTDFTTRLITQELNYHSNVYKDTCMLQKQCPHHYRVVAGVVAHEGGSQRKDASKEVVGHKSSHCDKEKVKLQEE